MCQAASFIVTRERTYFSKSSDSHTVIFEEHGIKDDGQAITVEVVPPDNDYRLPFEKWVFRLDSEHELPDWWNNDLASRKIYSCALVHLSVTLSGIGFGLLQIMSCRKYHPEERSAKATIHGIPIRSLGLIVSCFLSVGLVSPNPDI